MDKYIYYKLKTNSLPSVTLLDIASIKPPYVHYRRKAKEYILYFILSGEMYLTENNRQYRLVPNDVILLDPSHEHFGTEASTCKYAYIHFYHNNIEECVKNRNGLKEYLLTERMSSLKSTENCYDNPESLLATDLILPKFFHFNNTNTVISIIDAVNKALESHHSLLEHHRLDTSLKLMEFLISLSREFTSEFLFQDNSVNPKSTRIVHDMLAYLNSSYHTSISSITLETKFQCNFDYINRVFKEMIGKPIFVYLNEIRIEKAKHLLSNRIYTISVTSEKAGFHDVYYFSKVFKKHTGMTPSAYIKNYKAKL